MTYASVRHSFRMLRPAARRALAIAFLAVLGGTCTQGFAATFSVTNTQNSGTGSLRQAILDANASGAYAGIVSGSNTINVTATGTIALSDALPMIFSNLTINGNGITIDGGDAHRCFFVSGLPLAATPDGSPQAIAVALNDLQLKNCLAKGGDGGDGEYGGGGGLGAGGALFINTNAAVTANEVGFDGNSAVGGNGGSYVTSTGGVSGGGGGGLGGAGGGPGCGNGGGGIGGDGGAGFCDASSNGAAGGGGGVGGDGGPGNYGSGGGGGFGGTGVGQISNNQNFAVAGTGYPGLQGGMEGGGGGGGGSGGTAGQAGSQSGVGGSGGVVANGGGGGGANGSGGSTGAGGAGGIGGGSAGSILTGGTFSVAAAGGFGAGGGGFGGSGGFGGGGGSDSASGGFGGGGGGGVGGGGGNGDGGFGGGGGAAFSGTGGTSGFGGGDGASGSTSSGGGGGSGLGGAIFVVDGGTLSFAGSSNLATSQVAGGTGGNPGGQNGSAFGTGMFLQGDGTLVFDLNNSALYTLSDGIADTQGSGGGAGSGSWGVLVAGDGTGTLMLGAANTYSGPTDVMAGTLELDWNQVGCVLDYQVPMSAYSQSAAGTLSTSADYCGHDMQPVVTGTASLAGTVQLRFSATPPIGTTYTVLTAGTLSGTFDRSSAIVENSGTPKSVFGELTYATRTNGPQVAHDVLYTVVVTDEIFRDSFEPNGAYTDACVTKQQFADIWGTVLQNTPICVPPFTVTDPNSGTTVVACQTSTCSSTGGAGCQTMLHTSPGSMTGTLDTNYQVATPLTADDFSGPLHITGFAGTVDCTGTLSTTSAYLETTYWASHDYLDDAFVYQFNDAQVQGLTTNLSTSGCGFYGAATSFVQPYVIQQMQTQINNTIHSYIPTSSSAPGVGDTICPAP